MRPLSQSPFRPLFLGGMKIGLLGGSFDPPHQGHILVSEHLKKRLGLDVIWWLVTPQNPLKPRSSSPTKARLAACQKLIGTRKIYVSAEEEKLGTFYTADTLKALQAAHPHINFVWLMGADNLKTLHHWRDWSDIMRAMPVAVYPRGGETVRAGLAPAAAKFAQSRLPAQQASTLATKKPPAWVLVESVTSALSSTQLRTNNGQEHGEQAAKDK